MVIVQPNQTPLTSNVAAVNCVGSPPRSLPSTMRKYDKNDNQVQSGKSDINMVSSNMAGKNNKIFSI